MHSFFVFLTSLLLSTRFSDVYSSRDLQNRPCSTISLIHVVPSSYDEELSGWNVSELHILESAKRLATGFINNNPNLLAGVNLDILDVATDDCVREGLLQDLVGIFKNIEEQRCVLGVLGLYCSRVTRVIASIFGHTDFGYVQLSTATSPLLLNKQKYPYLYRVLSSGVLFNTAVVKMMDQFNWKNISLIYDFSDIFFRSTGIDFARQVRSRRDLNLLAFFPIRASGNHQILEDIVRQESRVTYFSVTHEESSDILCDAYVHNYFWPKYAYIFVDDSLEEILDNNRNNNCSRNQLLEASEGVFLLLNRLTNTDNPDHSEIYYQEYKRQLNITSKIVGTPGTLGTMQQYANVLYDQIWALAFAINNSLPFIKTTLNGSVEENIRHSSLIRDTLGKELMKVSFQGAHGSIKFNENLEVLTVIDIYQVISGKQTLIGEYNPNTEILTFSNSFKRRMVPQGDFEVRHDAIPVWLGVLVALSQGVLLVLYFLTCVYIIVWRDTPEVKSTSLPVNIFILSGCLMVIISSLFYNLENFAEASADSITAFCNLESWLFLFGISLILVSLMLRLLRIFIIFHYPKTKMTMLTNIHLVIYISMISVFPLLYLLTWTAADHIHQVAVINFIFSIADPHYTEHFYCSSNHTHVWIILYYSWISVLLITILVLAIQTRHIKYNDFKDTKKMGAFIFLLSMMLGTLLPMAYILQVDVPTASYIFKSMLTLLIPLTCLALQYFPKLFPVLTQRTMSHISNNLSFKNSKDQETSLKTVKPDQNSTEV